MLIKVALSLLLSNPQANASLISCLENLRSTAERNANHVQVEAFTKHRRGIGLRPAGERVAWIERILKTYTLEAAAPRARYTYRHARNWRAYRRLLDAEFAVRWLAIGLDGVVREHLIREFLERTPVLEFEFRDSTGMLSDRLINALIEKDVHDLMVESMNSARDYGREQVCLDHERLILTLPYRDTWRLLRRLELPKNSTFVDIGAASGSIGTIVGLARPDLQFLGLELVPERVREARRVAELLNLPNVHYEERNLSDHQRPLPEADTYFIFNPTNIATTRVVAKRLNDIGRHRPVRLIVSENSREYLRLIRADSVFHRVGDPETTSVVSMLIFESR